MQGAIMGQQATITHQFATRNHLHSAWLAGVTGLEPCLVIYSGDTLDPRRAVKVQSWLAQQLCVQLCLNIQPTAAHHGVSAVGTTSGVAAAGSALQPAECVSSDLCSHGS